jgi:macrophage erythroblast attacher
MPYNLSRQNFKSAQRNLEHQTSNLTTALTTTARAASKTRSPEKTLSDLDSIITKMQSLKRKLENLHEEEKRLNKASKARVQHLQDLYEIPSLVDVKYDEWSRVRLSRLLVDYLLRSGYTESAAHLALEKGIEELVDVDAFVACHRIEKSLREGRDTTPALSWCRENSQVLKKMGGSLEFELRLQQYIELVRQGHECLRDLDVGMDEDGEIGGGVPTGTTNGSAGEQKLVEARAHAKKFLSGTGDFEILGRAAGLLAYRPWDHVEPYAVRSPTLLPFPGIANMISNQSLYAPSRWESLATLFVKTHHTLYALPPRPLLHIALSAGLSALKTPSCHSAYTSSSANANSSATTVCPICSTELNELARNVPYAHHTKSIVEHDPVVLPNGRVYGRQTLESFNEKVGTESGWIRDPISGVVDGEQYKDSEVRKVFIM